MITNYLSPLEFRATIKRLPNVQFFLQRSTIPNVSQNPVEQSSPFNRIYHSADKLQYSNFDFTFIVDERMNNYLEIFNWMKLATFPEAYDQFKTIKNSEEGIYSDITVQILNSHKNADIEVKFVNCFPISLSDIILDTSQPDVLYPEVTATFQYDYFDITRLKD
jgi:hypothetical protein